MYKDTDSTERHQIHEVWAHNLEEEIQKIHDIVCQYRYIAIDTEFPGIVARPTGPGNATEYCYYTVKCNVDLLQVIQLGLTFADANGCLPTDSASTWQFNFHFDLDSEMYAQESIEFLRLSGVDFERHLASGIDFHEFGALIMGSGLVMNEDVKWVSFHGCYDFGYLLKLLTCKSLPHRQAEFTELLHSFFPCLYDIKVLLRNAKSFQLEGGSSLQKVAEFLNIRRVGPSHQAGSDSLLTCKTFFQLMKLYFGNKVDDSKYCGVIYGLASPATFIYCGDNGNAEDTSEDNAQPDAAVKNLPFGKTKDKQAIQDELFSLQHDALKPPTCQYQFNNLQGNASDGNCSDGNHCKQSGDFLNSSTSPGVTSRGRQKNAKNVWKDKGVSSSFAGESSQASPKNSEIREETETMGA